MNYQNASYSNCCDEALFFSDKDEELTVVAKSPPLTSFSPAPWLQQDAWVSMPRYEKESFIQHIIGGNFHSDQLKGAHKGCYANSTHFNFSDEDIDFGNSVDRVILGSGSRRVLVLVGIHGNEPCGVEAVKMILRKRKLFSANSADVTSEELLNDDNWATTLESLFRNLTIEFLLGSPAALRQNKRFVQRNLNRLFDLNILNDSRLALEDGYRYELHRARLITESIRHADFVLDIHSCSSDVGSFALPSSLDLSECLAEHLPVKYVVESLVHACLDGGTTLDAALWNDVPGVCVECGQHNHKDVVARAATVISTFLCLQIMQEEAKAFVASSSQSRSSEKPTIMVCTNVERVSKGFQWLKNIPEFHFVSEGEPVFTDAVRGVVKCPIEGGAYIVMPTFHPIIGEEALFWASAK